jgi:3-vinyl bacteriochlorophyllide hydratase
LDKSPFYLWHWNEGAYDLSTNRHIKSGEEIAILTDRAQPRAVAPLYTAAQRQRRDESPWTLVQGILAPIQFLVFGISLFLVLRYLMTGIGAAGAELSVVIKTGVLYAIMITGSIWEKAVFDEWLFAKPFFWEDVFSMAVLALHTAYLVMLVGGWGTPQERLYVALAGYVTYVINAGQFLYKLRLARLETPSCQVAAA